MIGQTVGSYHITGKLGAGGMGDVYRATDTRLGRDVAMKFPGERFSERFEREARAIAALNHPNICTLYDVAPTYLVMELVEGITLAERIAESPIPLEEALTIARQIAAALEEAHDKGVTHRDLKPANIKIRPDGTVKVLDFGLAKVPQSPAAASTDAAAAMSLSPTISMAATQAGVIVGTAAYMAPEQAKGKPVDKRADIWSFGVVLYEMLVGRPPFRGEDVGDVLASIIKEEPKWDELPTPVRRLLQKCLEKDPRKRLRDISGVDLLLDTGTPASIGTVRRPYVHYALEGALVLALGISVWLLWPGRQAERPLMRFNVDLGPDVSLGSIRGADAIISPDGNRIAFVSRNRLFTRRLDQVETVELPGTEGATAPFFSPDSGWLGFFAAGKLKKISMAGGLPIALADAIGGAGGTWGPDGTIIASLDNRTLHRVTATGAATQLTQPARDEVAHRWPQFLPNGTAIIFSVRRTNGEEIQAMSLENGQRRTLHKAGTFARYLARSKGQGFVLFVSGNTLFAAPFAGDRLTLEGNPAPVLDGVAVTPGLGASSAQFDVSRTGTLLYRTEAQGTDRVTLHWIDASGKARPLPTEPGVYLHTRVSPEGDRVAMTVRAEGGADIWIYDLRRDAMSRLTYGGGDYQFPVWTPDGRYIVFSSGLSGGGLQWIRADGASRAQRLVSTEFGQFPWSFTPDGKRLAYAEFPRGGGSGDIWTVPIEFNNGGLKAGKAEEFLKTAANELYPAFSPDGHWLAYRSLETGISQIYVRAFPDVGGKWQISDDGGVIPIWSSNGRELFYRTEDQRIMAVSYTTKGDAFVPDKPRQWTDIRLAEIAQRNLDISPDGKGFLGLLSSSPTNVGRNHINILQNFADELERRFGPESAER
jgi:serine/threonine-protein kinase